MRSSTSCTCLTTSSPSTISERSFGIRSATCSTARSSLTLMCSPANIASRRPSTSALLGELDQQLQRLVGDAVLGVVEEQPGALGDQALAAVWVLGEELAQVALADLGVVLLEGLPGLGLRRSGFASGSRPGSLCARGYFRFFFFALLLGGRGAALLLSSCTSSSWPRRGVVLGASPVVGGGGELVGADVRGGALVAGQAVEVQLAGQQGRRVAQVQGPGRCRGLAEVAAGAFTNAGAAVWLVGAPGLVIEISPPGSDSVA